MVCTWRRGLISPLSDPPEALMLNAPAVMALIALRGGPRGDGIFIMPGGIVRLPRQGRSLVVASLENGGESQSGWSQYWWHS